MTIDVELPRGWNELNHEQVSYYFWLSTKFPESQIEFILAYCFMRWGKMSVLKQYEDRSYDVKLFDGRIVNLKAHVIAEGIEKLIWLKEIPDYPVRLSKIGSHVAMSETMEELTFEQYLVCDNLYQGYLHTQNGDLIDNIGYIVYDKPNGKPFAQENRLMIFFWWASFKNYCTMQYRHLFAGAKGESDEDLHRRLTDSMNSQIRALTQGDITKEKEILAMPVHRALTELDAKARDYEELNKKAK